MATLKTAEAAVSRPALNAEHAGHILAVPVRFDIAVDNGGTAIATDDVVELADVPAGHVLVDLIIDTDAIASGVVDVGYTDGTGAEIIASQSVGTAGIFRADVAGATRATVNETASRTVAATFSTGSAATSGVFAATLFYRAAHHGI